jgi:hypothetical protein
LKDRARIQREGFTEFIAKVGKRLDGSTSAALHAAAGRVCNYASEAATAS